MKICAFEPWYNEKHQMVLRALAEGIPGAEVHDVRNYVECDIAIIFGLVKKAFDKTWSKSEILKRHQGKRLIVVESAFVNRGQYWTVGFGGIGGNAFFNNENMSSDRWLSMGIKTEPWQDRPDGPIIVCGQLPRDTNVQDYNHTYWCQKTVRRLITMGHSVLFRPHPKIEDKKIYGISPGLWDLDPIQKTLTYARAVVVFNSNSAIDALIAGVPVIACNDWSIARPVAVHRVANPLSLRFPSRRQFFANLAFCQWSLEEMKQGLTWNHLAKCLGEV